MAAEVQRVTEQGVLTLPDAAWEQALQRSQVIAPLAALEAVGHQAADDAAHALGLSRRQIYVLIQRARDGTGLITDLSLGQSSGGKGNGRLPEPVEHIIRELLQKRFLTRQKRSLAALYREITQTCTAQKLQIPARNTVALRIATLDPVKTARSRGGQDEARDLQGAGGVPPEIKMLLEQVQIDHTVIDLIIVDGRDRRPIGRPYLTLAIDVFTRCVVGMVITLEAPSAVSVGLCLAHAACDKRPWLERLDVEMGWPMMQMIHELPGTTFSNPDQRGEYDSDGMAVLTLHELERWLTLAIGAYHGSVHASLLQPPAALWADAVARSGTPVVVTHATSFLVDFLPVIRRTLTRTGFVIDHIHYYADALKPWIAKRGHLPAFLIRRDPRDISRIWVLETEGQQYLEISYRTLSHPAVTLWEQRQARERLRQLGREQVDEAALFRMIRQMRDIVDTAKKTTRKVRRDTERRQHLKTPSPPDRSLPPVAGILDAQADGQLLATPFDQIEEW